MEPDKQKNKRDVDRLGKEVDEALRKATREALKKHKIAGNSIAIWRNGKLVILKPDEISF
jgi:hypothetical protein